MIELSRTVLGNDILLDQLYMNFVNNKLSHSIIINGPKGMGKSTFAFSLIIKIFNKLINKDEINKNINLVYNNTHPNIRYIYKEFDEKNNKYKKFITIDQIRNLENFLYQSSFDNLPKFILIDSADDLNQSSSNSLLKSLEEPKKNTYFILISHQLSSILPTIRSRCVKFNINTLNFENFTKILQLNHDVADINNINFLFNLSNASPGLAIDISSNNIFDLYKNIINIFIKNKKLTPEIIALSNTVSKYSNEEFKIFLIIMRFILLTITKINLGLRNFSKKTDEFHNYIHKLSESLDNTIALKILEYLNSNEKELFVYNLDKKIFCLNAFNALDGTSNE